MVIRLVATVRSKLSLSVAKIIRKGQIMLEPMVLSSMPKNISQNWRG